MRSSLAVAQQVGRSGSVWRDRLSRVETRTTPCDSALPDSPRGAGPDSARRAWARLALAFEAEAHN